MLEDREYGLDLTLYAGKSGLSNRLHSSRIQKPGLALTGYTEHLHPDRLQVLGNTEISYLQQLPEDEATRFIANLCSFPISCFVVTKELAPPPFLKHEAEKAGIPLLGTPLQSSTFISLITKFLEERLLPNTNIHGVLVDVLGVGVLLLGKSGIGKSECALDLIVRGHRFVADDVIHLERRGPETYPVSAVQVSSWRGDFPGVDVEAEVRKARAWLEANPSRRKTYGGVPKFLVAWFGRAQDRSGPAPPAARGPHGRPARAGASAAVSRHGEASPALIAAAATGAVWMLDPGDKAASVDRKASTWFARPQGVLFIPEMDRLVGTRDLERKEAVCRHVLADHADGTDGNADRLPG